MPAFRAYEAALGLDWRHRRRLDVAGPPLPPARLRVLVSRTADPESFVVSGRRDVEMIESMLTSAGVNIGEFGAILDFGCGCGRVTRHWAHLPTTEVHGTDYNRKLVDWCARHLAFARFYTNELSPPTSFDGERFDFIYAISVLTHLRERLGRSWMEEFRRILRPGGFLLVTLQGSHYLARLGAEDRAAFEAGEVVVVRERAEGSNVCSTYHPRSYVEETLAEGFELKSFRSGSEEMMQDVVLFQMS
ncbi:MAG: class I SAM-dependent methyltransferase [Actinomycetota bacterium]|nr:class I SAM-dependent methyltransferase [Actinomycetota bacterium]